MDGHIISRISRKMGMRLPYIRHIRVGISPHRAAPGTLVLFPVSPNQICCGLAGLITLTPEAGSHITLDMDRLKSLIDDISSGNNLQDAISGLESLLQSLKTDINFSSLIKSPDDIRQLTDISSQLQIIASNLSDEINRMHGIAESAEIESRTGQLESLKDCHWSLSTEILQNIDKIGHLYPVSRFQTPPDTALSLYKKINTVLNGIDVLEVRGRDSAGISVMITLSEDVFTSFENLIESQALSGSYQTRKQQNILLNNGIRASRSGRLDNSTRSVAFVYKVAAEIGRLGDNVAFIRNQIANDPILKICAELPRLQDSINSHTRWASVGAITEANCHPVDNITPPENTSPVQGFIHVSLNGDIDNYPVLKKAYEHRFGPTQEEITTDTKIIALQIESYLSKGHTIDTAFRMAVSEFSGSHAIMMHTDLAPEKLFLAQKGSGQAIFVGMAADHLMATSEVYGFIQNTSRFIKMDGEKTVEGINGPTQGQVFILDGSGEPNLSAITATYYDGTPLELTDDDIKTTNLTSRDIDRQGFDHYFLKEISESPVSVEKTLLNRWFLDDKTQLRTIALDHSVVPESIQKAFQANSISRVFFMGQGTAGVAAMACADILNYYLSDPGIQVSALKSSELSGFILNDDDSSDAMTDALVIAISQSGTTTDTNRSVDMVKQRGAHTLAIVNRRDSDLTFKVDGVMYTSSGRDIEMSVASTKAFYSQIIAGSLLGLSLARVSGKREAAFVSEELGQMIQLPQKMRDVLSLKTDIEASARKLAVSRTYWATVGSGPNKSASDEIRIKLSELCYKTISSDYVEDKKHIDLSSEPLILVCAAGTRANVLGDVIKDVAIFNAHKALPVVITNEGEDRFDDIACDVFKVPKTDEHLAPILNTLVGHLWGYYAALAINGGSAFLFRHREKLKQLIDEYASQGLTVFEAVLEKRFREHSVVFYRSFREFQKSGNFKALVSTPLASDLVLLLKYLTGRLPVSDFEMDFSEKGTAKNMLDTLFSIMGEAINDMARPIDAIKHQAKTVTVGTSRISEQVDGILFDAVTQNGFSVAQISNKNVLVLKNMQPIIRDIKGSVLYRISGLNMLGEPTVHTKIEIVKKDGILKDDPSRVETDPRLKGTKSIIVREGNVFIGKGLKDGRVILVVPVISESVGETNMTEHLLSLNVSFNTDVPLYTRIKALGGKHERIRNLVQEKGLSYDDSMLSLLKMEELFGLSAEKTTDLIAERSA